MILVLNIGLKIILLQTPYLLLIFSYFTILLPSHSLNRTSKETWSFSCSDYQAFQNMKGRIQNLLGNMIFFGVMERVSFLIALNYGSSYCMSFMNHTCVDMQALAHIYSDSSIVLLSLGMRIVVTNMSNVVLPINR